MALILGVSLTIVLAACGKVDAPLQSASSQDLASVAITRAVRQNLTREVVLTAEFIPFQEVDVMAKVAGYVRTLSVDVGDHVQAGQVLATIEVPEMRDDVARAEATLEQSDAEVAGYRDEVRRSESAHEMAHRSWQRLAGVVKERPGLVAQQEIDDARSRDQMAEAQVAGATSRLAAAVKKVTVTRTELTRVNTMLAYTQVTAPFAGVITKRSANVGAMIQAGTASQAMPLVRVSQNSLLRLVLPVPESIVPLVRVGQAITVRVPTLGRTFPGRVARFSDRVQFATRTMDTEIDVPNTNYTLVAGMYAEVAFPTDSRNDVVTIPVTAVDLTGGSDTKGRVLMVAADGTLVSQAVSLGLETADRFEVTAGLREGDAMVLGNRANLRPGQRVRPRAVDVTAVQ